MAIRARLRSCTCHFNDDGSVHTEALVVLVDDVLGQLDTRVVGLTNPQVREGVRAAALALAPAIEFETGVPLDVPVPAVLAVPSDPTSTS